MVIDLNKIYEDAFGRKAPENRMSVPVIEHERLQSDLGQPFYAQDDYGREHFLPVRLNGWLIPFAVVSITEKKTIVSTPMPERGGSVKEIISVDDYGINIKGILMQDDNNWPEQDVIKMHDLFLINSSLELRNALTDIFLKGSSDHRVVIKQINWPAVAGVQHAKPFDMELESDMIFELEMAEQ